MAARLDPEVAARLDLPHDMPLAAAWRSVAQGLGMDPSQLASAVAVQLHLEAADLSAANAEALTLLPEKVARRYGAFPLRFSARTLTVASADPLNPEAETAIAFASGRRSVFQVASPEAVQEAIETHYAPDQVVGYLLEHIDVSDARDVRVVEAVEAESVREAQVAAEPVIRLTNVIVAEAVRAGATDIHIEPEGEGGRVRFRVDGVLEPHLRLPLPALVRVVSRLKVTAGMDIADRVRPQDGHMRVQVKGQIFDLRVSTVPAQEAEKCVVRLLPARASFSLSALGYPEHEAARIHELLGGRDGIVVVTGPTGSGKTTTLYAALQHLSAETLNISTVEDPIEYDLRGITQIQVEPRRDVTFASGLRALLRQDPDVILIGEIRDAETAQTAARAGMTGHLVLTTLHTNDALGAVPRLADLGLKHSVIADALRGIVAQRLVRRACPSCSVPVERLDDLPPRELRLAELFGVRPRVRIVGCPQCRGTGYRGRLPVAEVVTVTPELGALIARGAHHDELGRLALEAGMRSMGEAALERVAAGDTTLQEIERLRQTEALATGPESERERAPAARPVTVAAEVVTAGPSIAVFPFVNLTGDEEDQYFSDGITDDIIASLSRIRDLRVLSRSTVLRYQDVAKTLREIGEDLGVESVLEGSVRRKGDQVRIVAQLYDTRTDRNLWTETYDRRMEDIFAIQSDVAQRIAAALEARLTPGERERIERAPTESLEAYDLYLRGRFLWNKRTEEALRQSIEYYRKALREDPACTPALAGLADAHVTLGIYGAEAPAQAMRQAREAAEKALAAGAAGAEVHTALGCVRAIHDWDWPGAEAEFRRAIEIDPAYPTAHHWYAANLLTPLGRFDQARDELRYALRAEPLSAPILTTRGVLSFYARDYVRATDECRSVLALDAGFAIAHFFLGQILEQAGKGPEALDALRAAVRLSGESSETVAGLAHALATHGQEAEARDLLGRLGQRAQREYVSPTLRARVHVGLGERDAALALLEEACEARAADLVWIGGHPTFDPVRSDPRFARLVERMGLPSR